MTAVDVVRGAFAAVERGDMSTATAVFAPELLYRLHGDHPLAGEFAGKDATLGALGRMAEAGGSATALRLADAWPIGEELVAAHLVRTVGDPDDLVSGAVATLLRVEDSQITEIVSISDRALDTYWRSHTPG